MRKYDPETDILTNGWDASNIKYYLSIGAELIVDDNGEIWTADFKDYVGKIFMQHKTML